MPSFPVTELAAPVAICKTFRNSDKDPYPFVKRFKSACKTISTIEELFDIVKAAASKGACLLKGELDKELKNEPRAGHHLIDKPTHWVCLDIDHLPSIASIDDFLHKLSVTTVSYILQWSASYGIYGDMSIRAHIFMLLDQPCSPAVLKLWLMQLNFQHFNNDLTLVKNDMALSWGLDVTVCQNDKLIYVAPPVCNPSSINHFQRERIILVKKAVDSFSLPPDLLTVAQLETMKRAKVNELRKAKGLDPRKAQGFQTKEYKNTGIEYLPNPGRATITGVREDGDFVRLNMNGGDSWAYYHPKANPEFIYNFKDEPNYRTQELDPDYWHSVSGTKRQLALNKGAGKLILAFRDLNSGRYYNGWFDQDTDQVSLFPAKNERQIKDFLLGFGQPVPEAIPIWIREYNPHAGPINLNKQTVNLFKPSAYMVKAATIQSHQPFPTIDRLFRHAIGPSNMIGWYNWLAFIYQKRTMPATAWVWYGTQGTGKGKIFHNVLAPLFGHNNVSIKRMEELEDKFNEHLEHSMICFIDEAQVSDSKRSKIIMANLKNQITEPVITIRPMRSAAYNVPNRVGWIFASNMPDAVTVDPSDRRFNVGEYQRNPIELTDADIDALEAELLDFAVFLRLYQVDTKLVRTPVMNTDKEKLISHQRTSADDMVMYIKRGQLSELWDQLPDEGTSFSTNRETDAHFNYRKLMIELVKNPRDRLTRTELMVIFSFCVGNVVQASTRFSRLLSFHGLDVDVIRVGNTTKRGVMVNWTDPPEWFAEKRAEIQQAEQIPLKVVK